MRRRIALGAATAMAITGIAATSAAGSVSGHGHANADGHARAVAEARALLSEAPTLTGFLPRGHPPVPALKGAPERAAYDHLVQRARFWTVTAPWRQVYAELTATSPAGLVPDGSGRSSGPMPGDRERFAAFTPRRTPTGIAYAELIVAVAPLGDHRAAIGVYAQAVAQPRRPQVELVPPSVRRVHVAVRKPSGRVVRGHTVTGAAASRLVRDFNALPVTPPGAMSCPADFGRRELVTFHAAGHTIVATAGFCGLVSVTRDGHRLPSLTSSQRFGKDIDHDLAPAS